MIADATSHPSTAPPSISLVELNESKPTETGSDATRRAIDSHETHNLAVLIAHHIVLRIAWIFKTETVIIPAFMDSIAGAGWLRGCLPILNRVGQSVPPLLLSERLRSAKFKKHTLLLTSFGMATPFLILSGIMAVNGNQRHTWLPYVFLLLYFAFFSVTGLNQLAFGTIQGKLIRPERRGRLLSIAGLVGAIMSIAFAWVLLRRWLGDGQASFARIFCFTGGGFVVAGLICFALREPVDDFRQRGVWQDPFRNAWQSLCDDVHLRRLAIVAMLFVTAQILFPHYQALGRTREDWRASELMFWVVAQNSGAGLFSLLAGAIADRCGNRLALRLLVLTAALTPATALILAGWSRRGPDLFWLTFVLLGAIPTCFKIIVNYSLEITERESHPHYISTIKLCMPLPLLLSPLVGWLVDTLGFTPVFTATACVTALGAMMTLFMIEPRASSIAAAGGNSGL